MNREHASIRELAARQLRGWRTSGQLGLNLCAHRAMMRAAIRLGYPTIQLACTDGAWPDMMSEAIEDVESPS